MTHDEFLAKVKNNPLPLVVDVWAPWCAPCRVIAPALDRLSAEHSGRVDVWKINADDEPALVRGLGVLGIPTLLAYRGGVEMTRQVGAAPESHLRLLFDRALGASVAPRSELTARDRIVRVSGGIGLAVLGIALTDAWPLGLAGGLLIFSGVYDRCPLWRALAPKLIEWVRGDKAARARVGGSG